MSTRGKKFGPRLTVSLTENDYNRLNVLAEKDDVSVSWVVRRAIEDYLLHRPEGPGASSGGPVHGRDNDVRSRER